MDVNVDGDVALFIDPAALRNTRGPWAKECVALLHNFFFAVVEAMRAGDDLRARRLLAALREPNETHLGLSRDRARGRALGEKSAKKIFEKLSKSRAIRSGLLSDLEEAILMVEGVGADLISDLTTNIIREPLIQYTQEACRQYGIPLTADMVSGPLWDPHEKRWTEGRLTELPIANGRRLLLVPKMIARQVIAYSAQEFYRNYILANLRDVELKSPNQELVTTLKSGERLVRQKHLLEKYGNHKSDIEREALKNPKALGDYKRATSKRAARVLVDSALSEVVGRAAPDYDALLNAVIAVEPGNEGATIYHRAVDALLTALFYPALAMGKVEQEIDEGRKRIDIMYTNVSTSGFFAWSRPKTKAVLVPIECKNYTRDLKNPELDQMIGRLNADRGLLGLIVCRGFEDKVLFLKRCRDTAKDRRGYIIVLDDEDLKTLVAERKALTDGIEFKLLYERYAALIS